MPIIRVEMFSGRSEEAKRALVKELTEACTKTIRCKAEQVTVVITDVEKINWGEGGKVAEARISDQRGRQ